MNITIRELNPADLENFHQLQMSLDQETSFMMLEPGERIKNISSLEKLVTGDLHKFFVAEAGGKFLGYIHGVLASPRRIRHRALIIIGILKEAQSQGLGTNFFQHFENWALKNNIHRMYLTVICSNEKAIALYKKMGFEIEGTEKDSMLIDGEYVDQYLMSKLL